MIPYLSFRKVGIGKSTYVRKTKTDTRASKRNFWQRFEHDESLWVEHVDGPVMHAPTQSVPDNSLPPTHS